MGSAKCDGVEVLRISSHEEIDLPALSALLASVGMRRRGEARMRTAIRASTDVFAAYLRGDLVGFGRLVSDTVYYGAIWDLAVRSDLQQSGIGSRLLDRLLGRARGYRLVMVGLFTAAHNRQFYEKHGFEFHSKIFAMTRLASQISHA